MFDRPQDGAVAVVRGQSGPPPAGRLSCPLDFPKMAGFFTWKNEGPTSLVGLDGI